MPEMILTDEVKKEIDGMSHIEMTRFYRFTPSDHPWIQSADVWKYFIKRFYEFGGFTTLNISRTIGW